MQSFTKAVRVPDKMNERPKIQSNIAIAFVYLNVLMIPCCKVRDRRQNNLVQFTGEAPN